MQGNVNIWGKLLQNLYYIIVLLAKIKIGTQNRNNFHKVCLHNIIAHYIISNFHYIYYDYVNFKYVFICFVFTLLVSPIAIGKSFEVSGNNESLDTIFKSHILRLIFKKNLRA